MVLSHSKTSRPPRQGPDLAPARGQSFPAHPEGWAKKQGTGRLGGAEPDLVTLKLDSGKVFYDAWEAHEQ